MSKSKTSKSEPKDQAPTRTPAAAPLATQLRAMIGNSGLTVNGLAVAVGIPQPVLQRFVSGERDDLHLSTADKLCAHFGVRLTAPKGKGKQAKGK